MSHYAQNGEGMEVDLTKTSLGRSSSVNQKIHYVGGENAPEVVPQMEQQHGMYQEGVYDNVSAPSYGQEQVAEKSGKGSTICGMRKKLFWILLGVLALVVIVVVVVVAVVVTKNNSNSNDGSTSSGSSLGSGSGTSTATATATSSGSSPSATAGDIISDGSEFAAIKSGNSMQFFYQTNNGSVFYEVQTGEKITSGPSIVPGLTGAKSGTPLATVSWNDGAAIRLYYLNSDNEIQEYAYDNSTGWYSGSLSGEGIRAVDTSRLAAIKYGDNLEIRLYFQVSGGVVQEYTWKDESWSISQSLPVGITGTGLAALYYPDNNIRVYYQTNETSKVIHEISYGWPNLKGWDESKAPPQLKNEILHAY
ncbi:hypothetical protein P167DRAFT_434646 [Morchella conica CCBAS932]|uniref:Uncharacterized protein n=1 Tax=Morchella conica CCBAS932 TaxID=1392247 RepID=A0A3N4KCS8_9PEZI|nr:hypothetical protein P167DRAFT_434646 [Morchella conica CCBAS932]